MKRRDLIQKIETARRDETQLRFLADAQRRMIVWSNNLIAQHSEAADRLHTAANGLLLQLMNSGISHRRFLKLVKQWEALCPN